VRRFTRGGISVNCHTTNLKMQSKGLQNIRKSFKKTINYDFYQTGICLLNNLISFLSYLLSCTIENKSNSINTSLFSKGILGFLLIICSSNF
jgi:hypothetical protein